MRSVDVGEDTVIDSMFPVKGGGFSMPFVISRSVRPFETDAEDEGARGDIVAVAAEDD